MLSGIKIGKKKRQKVVDSGGGTLSSAALELPQVQHHHPSLPSRNNVDAAASLRAQLLSGYQPAPVVAQQNQQHLKLPYDTLEQSGRIGGQISTSSDHVVVLTGKANISATAAESYFNNFEKEDYRNGSRKGKVKRKAIDTIGTTEDEAGMSIQDMLKAEKESKQSMDEVYARNVARMGSRYKGKELKAGSAAGADEDEFVDTKVYQHQSLTTQAVAQRETSRQLAMYDQQTRMTQKCWWWMESPSFSRHMLIALGNFVSLNMAPSHLSLEPGHQFYLVPLQHADSLVGCDDNVWNELARFQQSLRQLYAKEGKDVIFTETVLGGKGFWQTRLQANPIPRKKNDAPMYFKQAMLEQTEEWGTHNKIMPTKNKGLRQTIPKNFNYFYVEWDAHDGFAQILENNRFPKDFAVDTMAGMLQMDPIRFRRNQRQSEAEEKQMVLNFLKDWKTVDWTLELEG